MARLLKPVTVVIVVPIIVAVVAFLARQDLERRWLFGLGRQMVMQGRRPTARLMARLALPVVCREAGAADRMPVCPVYLRLGRSVSGAAIVSGLGLLYLGGLVWGARLMASGSRAAAARFAVVFRGAAMALGGVILLNGLLLLLAGGAVGQALDLASVSGAIWGAVLVVSLTAMALHAVWVVARRRAVVVLGRSATLDTQPRLADAIRSIATAVGADPPERVVFGLAPGLFVSDQSLVCLDGVVDDRVLHLPLPLCRVLTRAEFGALVAQELAAGRRTQAAARHDAFPALASAQGAVDELRGAARGLRALLSAPALQVLSMLLESAAPAMAQASRAREHEADRSAARVAGVEVLASALVKTHAFDEAWQAVLSAMVDAVWQGEQYTNASALFAATVQAHSGPERLRGLGDLRLVHPTRAHATLADRIERLGAVPEHVAAAALRTRPEDPAWELVEGAEAIECDLTAIEHTVMATELGVTVGARAGCPVPSA